MPWPLDDKPISPLLYGSRVGNAMASPPEPEARNASALDQAFMGLNALGGRLGYPDIANRTADTAATFSLPSLLALGFPARAGLEAANALAARRGIGSVELSPWRQNLPDGDLHIFDMVSPDTRQKVGLLGVTRKGDTLHINTMDAGRRGSNSIGIAAVRDVYRQLGSLFPDAKAIEGQRVSGARSGGNYLVRDDAPMAAVGIRK